jgi:hypothetical protein
LDGASVWDTGPEVWVEENTLLITLIGIQRKTVYRIAKDLCGLFNQESVMITGTSVLKFNVRDYEE